MIEKISYDKVIATADSLSASSNKMKSILDETNQKMQKVNTEDTWKSNAAEELYAKFKSLASKFENFYNAIEAYSRFLRDTVDTYKTADTIIANKAEELLDE